MAEKTFFGHPRGLATLFFTEMWERFSYYGMRALLILFMTASLSGGGMELSVERAGAIYGLYTFGVYALALPGGWIADRLVGQRRAVLYGGILIALGHYSLAIPAVVTFYLGLLLIVLGTGLLKPNVSAIVGDLYEHDEHPDQGGRRDAGFSIFYMGINLGALLGPLICSWLGEKYNWHLGFGAAGVGMTFALVQYVVGQKHLRGAGELKGDSAQPERLAAARRSFVIGVGSLLLAGATLVWLSYAQVIPLTLVKFAEAVFFIVAIVAALYFALVIVFVCRDNVERQRIGVCVIMFLGAALFWAGFEQAGSSMNLFARDFTDRSLLGFEVTAGALQSVNPVFIVLMAPVIGMIWVKLAARNPSIPVKFGLGLVLLGIGFLILAWGSTYLETGKVGMRWLVVTYFFHTVGELCLSPVGLSSITKLAPQRLVGQMMGTWFMGAAVGNLVAGLAARYMPAADTIDTFAVNGARLFTTTAAFALVAGLMFIVFSRPIRKLCVGVN